ncbi:hypothetical protein BV372_16435 [Nostoc sp. T09]|uniref:hypothetical protein n=1 Tax=Nostoc sp. T09 TaxID=1932621 RepID=UPI000A38973A|nr:hypothetical protein [Nostoc sp. T09]OUL33438.1 hypothetical protein BV372_16435 [Nostoc sp. T09]
MLVFFIHGVAESKVKFAQDLKYLIKDELSQRGKDLPYFHSGFYADVLNKKDKIWNFIDQDLKKLKEQNPNINLQDIFRGQEIRREFLSDFVGDAFTYLNLERGAKIREAIAGHLEDFIVNHPEEKDFHIVAHSMGTVILWDILFSDKFQPGDAAYKIRSLILEKVNLKSITTMGSPIILFNMILDITLEQVNKFALIFQEQPIRWTNIIHSSDLIAYPISSSLKISDSCNLSVKNKFISTVANDLEKTVRGVAEFPAIEAASNVNPGINQAFSVAAIASGAPDAHVNYWKCSQTAKILVDNILGDEEKIIDLVIERLKKVPGMTITLIEGKDSAQKPDSKMDNDWDRYFGNFDKLQENFQFLDSSGKLRMRDNVAQIPHVSVYNQLGNCQFKGYVGLLHANGLRQEVEVIKQKYRLKIS